MERRQTSPDLKVVPDASRDYVGGRRTDISCSENIQVGWQAPTAKNSLPYGWNLCDPKDLGTAVIRHNDLWRTQYGPMPGCDTQMWGKWATAQWEKMRFRGEKSAKSVKINESLWNLQIILNKDWIFELWINKLCIIYIIWYLIWGAKMWYQILKLIKDV